jgi:hypothetical protein
LNEFDDKWDDDDDGLDCWLLIDIDCVGALVLSGNHGFTILLLIGQFFMLDSDCTCLVSFSKRLSSVRSFLLNVDDVDDRDEIENYLD